MTEPKRKKNLKSVIVSEKRQRRIRAAHNIIFIRIIIIYYIAINYTYL